MSLERARFFRECSVLGLRVVGDSYPAFGRIFFGRGSHIIEIGVPISPDISMGPIVAQSDLIKEVVFCSFKEDTNGNDGILACRANQLLDFLHAALAPSHTVGGRVRHRRPSTRRQASRETDVASFTVGFLLVQKLRKDGPGHCQPYAPGGWRGGGGKVRVLSEFSWPFSELNCQTTPKQAFHF